jgi:4'-phosphopantetheinyl transferase
MEHIADLARFPARPRLEPDTVEVIHLAIGEPARGEARLSEDERARAARFVFDRDRIRYTNARTGLRQVLGACLGIAPAAVRLTYGPRGKPQLVSAAGGIRFNLSHSGDRAIVAVALGAEVGVDIERVRDDLDHAGLAESFFTVRERAEIAARPAPACAAAFFRCWVAKESYLKALGEGLIAPLDALGVDPAARPDTIRWTAVDTDARAWDIELLPATPGHVAALACRAGAWRIRHWNGFTDEEGPDAPGA